MAYHGYIPFVKRFLYNLAPDRIPHVLEVGVDRGITFIPLVVFMSRLREQFLAVGVDVKVQESTQVTLQHVDLASSQQAYLVENNSLDLLPKMVEQGMKFDVILLDGDHNYHTVKEELQYIPKLLNPGGFVICDDYDGRWSERDLWYAEREGYEDVGIATKPVQTEKHGVKPAVDEWLEANPGWQKMQPIQGEPVILMPKADFVVQSSA